MGFCLYVRGFQAKYSILVVPSDLTRMVVLRSGYYKYLLVLRWQLLQVL
ncbi:hypothetical protein [Pontibacter amylolyticus]|nr:hypothetical protein [Pontibacter amylolyticus]